MPQIILQTSSYYTATHPFEKIGEALQRFLSTYTTYYCYTSRRKPLNYYIIPWDIMGIHQNCCYYHLLLQLSVTAAVSARGSRTVCVTFRIVFVSSTHEACELAGERAKEQAKSCTTQTYRVSVCAEHVLCHIASTHTNTATPKV